MIVLTKFPITNVNGSTALPSRWSSVHQPIFFEGCRRDMSIIKITPFSGVWRILLSSAPPVGLAIGHKIWVSSGSTNAELTVGAISGTALLVTGAVAGSSLGGYCNFTTLRKNYYVTLKIYVVDANNVYQYIGAHELRPSVNGSFSFDPHGYLKSYAEMTDTFKYNVKNLKQVKQGSRFNFSHKENWMGSSNTESALSTTTQFFWTNAVKQLQEKYNFNVGKHVLFPSIDTAKFMTDFEQPTYFVGFPFSLSFIWSDKVAGRELQRVEDSGTVNTTVLDPSQRLFVNKMMLAGGYASTVDSIEVWLNDNGITTIKYVDDTYVGTTYVKEIPAEPLTYTE
jgi:hypothetical protein